MAPRRPCPRNPNGHQGREARIQRNRVMDKAPTFVGIDVSKRRLDVHARPSGEGFAVDCDDEGVAGLVGRLAALAPALVVLEATGGLEVRLAAALAAAGLPVAVVNPRQVRAFARAAGRLAKTDRLDAEAIARFAEAVRPPARPLPDEATRRLGALVARRRQLLEMLVAERNRRYAADPALHEGIDAHLHWLGAAGFIEHGHRLAMLLHRWKFGSGKHTDFMYYCSMTPGLQRHHRTKYVEQRWIRLNEEVSSVFSKETQTRLLLDT